MPQPAELSFVIDLRGKTPQEVVELLAPYFETSCSDISGVYVEAYARIYPGLVKAECVWLDWLDVERLSFIFAGNKKVRARRSYHLILLHFRRGKLRWSMGNTAHLAGAADMTK